MRQQQDLWNRVKDRETDGFEPKVEMFEKNFENICDMFMMQIEPKKLQFETAEEKEENDETSKEKRR